METVGKEAAAVVVLGFESTAEIFKKEKQNSYGQDNYKAHSDTTPV